MMLLECLGGLVLGGAIGPVLVRAVARLPEDQALWQPPLKCPECQTRYPIRLHLPLLGRFLVRQSCPACQAPLSWQAFWIEFLAFFSTFAILAKHGYTSEALMGLIFSWGMIVLAFIDGNHLSIEPRIVVFMGALQVSLLMLYAPEEMLDRGLGLLVGAGGLYWVGFLYETLRRRQGLGEGDPAVLGVIGLWVGWQGLAPVLVVASILGLMIGGGLIWIKRLPWNETKLPFAPALCAGGAIVYGLQVWLQLGIGSGGR